MLSAKLLQDFFNRISRFPNDSIQFDNGLLNLAIARTTTAAALYPILNQIEIRSEIRIEIKPMYTTIFWR